MEQFWKVRRVRDFNLKTIFVRLYQIANNTDCLMADMVAMGLVLEVTCLERHKSNQPLCSVQLLFCCGSLCNTTKSGGYGSRLVLSAAPKVSQQASFCAKQLLQEASS